VEIQNTKESFDLAAQAAVHYFKTSPPDVLAEVPGLS